jgi:DNA-binding NarL/FixJ family response regulator
MVSGADATVGVLIVDDNPIVRAALRAYLGGADDVRVLAEAGHGQEAVNLARRLNPTVTLLDHRMPIADGLSVITTIAQHSAVLVLTSDDDPQLIAAMLYRGARGYLVHGEFDPPELLRAVKEVAAGRGWLSPVAASVAAAALRDQLARERARHQYAERAHLARTRLGLTDREEEVLNLLCQGLSNASIAERLVLTEKTVKNHLNHIFAKLHVTSRTEAIVRWTAHLV